MDAISANCWPLGKFVLITLTALRGRFEFIKECAQHKRLCQMTVERTGHLHRAAILVRQSNLVSSRSATIVVVACIPQYVAGAPRNDKLVAQLLERSTIIVGDCNDLALRAAHTGDLLMQHDRLAIPDQ